MSTINYTYNVIVDRFRQFAAGHFQLRRFTHGEISQADLEKEAEWPWMHVKPRAINYSPGTRAFSFEIFISDLPRDKEDKTGYQAESITDCSLIFQDLINEIHLGHMFGDDVVLTRPVNSEPFVEQYTHTLTGVTGVIELSLDYDWSACSIPASWNYNTPTNSPSDGWGALQFIESLDQNGVFVSLLNDLEAPGNSYYYGTDAAGIKGWYAIVDNIGLTCETLPECATIISILEDIAALETEVALKANTADLGATAFSNSYNDLDNLPTIPAAQVNSDWNATSGVEEILNKPTIPTSLPPSGAAGGDLTGTYPNPTVHRIHGIDMQNGTPTANDTWVYGGSPAKWQHQHLNASQVDNDSSVTGATVKLALEHLDSTKQATLVSGTNIKTVNSNSLLGAGNVSVGTVTSVSALTLGTTGTDLTSTVANGTTTPVITLNVPTASATNRGALSSTDWSTFNGKFTLPSLTSGSVLFSNGTTIAQNNASFFWDNTNARLGVGTATPAYGLEVIGTARVSGTFTSGGVLTALSSGTIGGTTIIGTAIFQVNGTNKLVNYNASYLSGSFYTYQAFGGWDAYGADSAAGTILAVGGYRASQWVGITFHSNGSERMRIATGGNVLIGTTTDAGYKLDVNGTARISGQLNNPYWILYGNASILQFPIGAARILTASHIAFEPTPSALATGDYGIYLGKRSPTTWSATSGSLFVSGSKEIFAPTSGTATFGYLALEGTINQTGGANGVTRGLYINPTLTAAADFRAIEVTAGTTVLAPSVTARASLRIPSGTAPTSPVNGDIWFDGTDIKMQIGGVTKTFTLL